ncbi:MAG: transposase [Chromatiaceae bacterium]
MLGKAFERFIKKAPVAVMVQGVLERVLNPEALNTLYERATVKQYTRELLFSSVVGLMNLVVCRIHPSIHAAYQDHKEEIATSITSVYNKLNGIDTQTSRALVRDTAEQMGEAVHGLNGARTPWLAGYRVKVLDGNCIEATHHRRERLRGTAAGAWPGKSLVIYEPQLEMATDVFPCEDGHAQERALLGAVLPTVEPRDTLIMDRNFCVRDFLHGIAARQGYFICRQHQGLPWEAEGDERFIGRSERGAIYEQWVRVSDSAGKTRRLRRIRIVLKQATRDGDKVLTLLTNLSKTAAHAKHIAWMYRKRWTIETACQELEAHLHSEINSLGYPKAALFGFCVALLASNVLALVKAALRSVHGEQTIADKVSGYYLAGHLERTYDGMMIAIPEDEWRLFREMSTERFIQTLQQLARNVDLAKFRKHKRGPKKPTPKRTQNSKQPHVSTARLLKG